MTAADLYKPIDANSYARGILEGRFVLDHQVGLKSDGSLCLIVRELKTAKKGLKLVQSYGAFRAYNITDLVAAGGAVLVNQGTNPWKTLPQQNSILTSGGGQTTLSHSTDILIQSLIITTDGTAGSRTLKVGATQVTTKSVGPSATGDLLDHALALPKNTTISIGGGAALDTFTISYLDLGT